MEKRSNTFFYSSVDILKINYYNLTDVVNETPLTEDSSSVVLKS